MLTTTLLAFLMGFTPVAQDAERPLARIVVESQRPGLLAAELTARGFDVLGVLTEPGRVELIATDAEWEELTSAGHAPALLGRGRPLGESLGPGQLALGSLAPAGYPDLATVQLSLAAYAGAYPGLARVVDLTQTYGTPTTAQGRHLFALVISDNVDVREDEPAVLLVSAHHAREIVTPLIALEAAGQLLNGYGTAPDITAAVDSQEIWIIPVQNPDGYNHVFVADNTWRKNRRILPTGIGVDLNRNYPPGWGAGCGGGTSGSSSTYQGPAPASEPETQTLIALSDDRRFAKVLDFHSSGQEARYGYGCWTHPLDSFLADEAAAFSLTAGWSGATGSSCCLAGEIHYQMKSGAHALLLETATEFQPTYFAGKLEAIAVWNGIRQTLARDLSLSGHVIDALTLLPLEATLEITGVDFTNGESFGSGGDFGRYHATLPAGSYVLTFSAPGYVPAVHPVTVAVGTPIELDVALRAEGNAWQNLAGGSAGSGGTPLLQGTGTLAPNTPVTLGLTHTVPGALVAGWLSTSSAPIPVAGGTLYTQPLLRQFLFFATQVGGLEIATTWPPGVPVGTPLWVQFLCEDAFVGAGFTLSNALTAVTP